MTILRIVLIVVAVLVFAAAGVWLYTTQVANPRIARELVQDPNGERARKVMLLTLPGGRQIPVNYLREDTMVYAGADGSWWKELVGDGVPVTVLVRGETLEGRARAVLNDPSYTARIFAKLRPDAIEGFGTLVEIRLDPTSAAAPLP